MAVKSNKVKKSSSSKKVSPKKASSKKPASKKTTTKKVQAKKVSAKRSAPKKTTSKKTISKKATPKKTASKKIISKKTAPKKTISKKATSKKAVAKKMSPKKAPSKKMSSKKPAQNSLSKRNLGEKYSVELYSVELLRITKNIDSILRIEDIDIKFKSGDITAIFSNEPKIETALATIAAGVTYADKGVIGISENINPKRDFLYINSDSTLPNGVNYDFFAKNIVATPVSNKSGSKKESLKKSFLKKNKKNRNTKKSLKNSASNFRLANIFAKNKNYQNNLDYSYIESVAADSSGYSKYKLIVFDNPTQKMSVLDKEKFWKQLSIWLKKNSHIISLIVTPDFDEIENLINNVVIVKKDSSVYAKRAAEFVKKSTLKERVINAIAK
ncbi:MAG: histone H1-like repetitive region-containing protein [Bifidobacteriaceae bacterium]|jgi:ABC-type Na+ transport system ATPase subunit NatA|nr:histone H1-like repetitive region-containing protein [Bifidobacteriaceae bacterium]